VRRCLELAETGLAERVSRKAIDGQRRRWRLRNSPDQRRRGP
jgi:hypothetical protein